MNLTGKIVLNTRSLFQWECSQHITSHELQFAHCSQRTMRPSSLCRQPISIQSRPMWRELDCAHDQLALWVMGRFVQIAYWFMRAVNDDLRTVNRVTAETSGPAVYTVYVRASRQGGFKQWAASALDLVRGVTQPSASPPVTFLGQGPSPLI